MDKKTVIAFFAFMLLTPGIPYAETQGLEKNVKKIEQQPKTTENSVQETEAEKSKRITEEIRVLSDPKTKMEDRPKSKSGNYLW